MKFGLSIGVSPREDIRRLVNIAKQAEAAAIDALWVIDSQFAMKDAYVAVTTALWETETLLVGTGVTNLQTRHPSVVANAFATLSEMSGGRALVGLGAGDSAVFPLGSKPSRVNELESGIAQLRSILAGGKVDFGSGSEVGLPFVPAQRPPVYLSASQPRMLELAGRVADGVIVMGAANRELIAEQLKAVASGARAAGRSPEDIFTDVWVTVSVDGERGRGIDDIRSWASAKARWMASWKDLPASLEAFRPEMNAAAEAYDFSDHLSVHAGHASAVSDELAQALAVAGTSEECVQRLLGLSSLGADRLTITLLPKGRERRLEILATEVLPRLG